MFGNLVGPRHPDRCCLLVWIQPAQDVIDVLADVHPIASVSACIVEDQDKRKLLGFPIPVVQVPCFDGRANGVFCCRVQVVGSFQLEADLAVLDLPGLGREVEHGRVIPVFASSRWNQLVASLKYLTLQEVEAHLLDDVLACSMRALPTPVKRKHSATPGSPGHGLGSSSLSIIGSKRPPPRP